MLCDPGQDAPISVSCVPRAGGGTPLSLAWRVGKVQGKAASSGHLGHSGRGQAHPTLGSFWKLPGVRPHALSGHPAGWSRSHSGATPGERWDRAWLDVPCLGLWKPPALPCPSVHHFFQPRGAAAICSALTRGWTRHPRAARLAVCPGGSASWPGRWGFWGSRAQRDMGLLLTSGTPGSRRLSECDRACAHVSGVRSATPWFCFLLLVGQHVLSTVSRVPLSPGHSSDQERRGPEHCALGDGKRIQTGRKGWGSG